MISENLLRSAVERISKIEGLAMDENDLVEDVFMLAYAFPDEDDFMAAVANTCRSMNLLVRGKVDASALKYEFDEWHAFHYQHRVGQGARVTCRIMFRNVKGGIEVKGFGHRHVPEDFYARMGESRPA